MTLQPFPADWHTALVLVPHPDDPEYGIGAAVAKWTSEGRRVHYALASRGEAGIEGLAPHVAGPLREREQIRSAGIVGVDDVTFWDFPDSRIRDTPALRARIVDTLDAVAPDVVVTIFSGPEWAPGQPNQRDHIEFATAVTAAYDSLVEPPRWLFENGPGGTHGEVVDGFVDVAVESLAAHERYLSVLDPTTPVYAQARRQVEEATAGRPEFGGRPAVEFILTRTRSTS
ncbi:PIG-L deacetylase family protein [Mycolicibacterium baixiangningiae]|uniref:PIG-L deacetylase family protein n=1 Tax=Mycolicibacterium baixiangningiae TaxID=2761578 RepID=UPI0018D1A398|nr:PIG-L deacetylase family protein [Mycolicibacterium baixiangningiae]